MTNYEEKLISAAATRRHWSYKVASEKARELAMRLNVTIHLVAPDGAYGREAWDISKESNEEREAYAVVRDEELRKLHPDRYPPPLTDLQKIAAKNQVRSDEQDAEIRRLWEHDNPGLRELYYPVGYPSTFSPNGD